MSISHGALDDPQTYELIGVGMTVHNELGCGFLEPVYQRAYAIELQQKGIPYSAEISLPIHYKGQPLDLRYRVDFICYGEVLVEVKALKGIGGIEEGQMINYLRASKLRRGLILNFGARSLQSRRLVW
jgi:GxxExxY protein